MLRFMRLNLLLTYHKITWVIIHFQHQNIKPAWHYLKMTVVLYIAIWSLIICHKITFVIIYFTVHNLIYIFTERTINAHSWSVKNKICKTRCPQISEFLPAKYRPSSQEDNYCYHCDCCKSAPVDFPVKIGGDSRLPVVLRSHEHQRSVISPGCSVIKTAIGQEQRQQSHKSPHDPHNIGNSRFLAAHCERMQQYINSKSGHDRKEQ